MLRPRQGACLSDQSEKMVESLRSSASSHRIPVRADSGKEGMASRHGVSEHTKACESATQEVLGQLLSVFEYGNPAAVIKLYARLSR